MMARAWCLAPVAVVMLAVPLGAQTAPARGNAPSRPAPPSLQPSGYDPGQRRDPFVSLLKTGQDAGRGASQRPAGVAGLLVSEVALRGVLQSPGGFSALLQGPDTRTYVVHVGDRLFDGQVRLIAADGIVLLQRVSDPLAPSKEVEVRKRLRQVGEGRR